MSLEKKKGRKIKPVNPVKQGITSRHRPTAEQRKFVASCTMVGVDHAAVAAMMGISVNLLYKYYRDELDYGLVRATALVAGSLFQKCMAGNVQAQIFWLKCQGGWKAPESIDVTNSDGSLNQPTVIELIAPDMVSDANKIETD